MIAVIVFVGPEGAINWDNTQTMVRYNWEPLCEVMRSSGIPVTTFAGRRNFESNDPWDAFTCELRCKRVLPLDCAQMDHRIEQRTLASHFSYTMGSFLQVHNVKTNRYDTVHKPSVGVLGRESLYSPWKVYDKGDIYIIPILFPRRTNATYEYNFISKKITITFPEVTGVTTSEKEYDLIEVLRNDVTNVRPLCPPCNGSRNAKTRRAEVSEEKSP